MNDAIAPRLRAWRRQPLWAPADTTSLVAYGRATLERIVGHHLLVDAVTAVDLHERAVRGRCHVRRDDPVFAGHFPGQPIYPGVLQLETMRQAMVCLMHFCATGPMSVASDVTPRAARVSRIHHAVFQAEILPDDNLDVLATVLESGGRTTVCAGQILRGDIVCALAVTETEAAGA